MAETALAQQGSVQIARIGGYTKAEIVSQGLWRDPNALRGKANVTFPITALDDLPPFTKPALSVVTVNADSADAYSVGGGKFGLSKNVIMQMLNARGISVESTRKLTPPSDLDHIEYQATVVYQDMHGRTMRQTATRTWDWQKVQEVSTPGEAKAQRKFADEMTETKAILRAARAALNIRTSYTKEELALPFLIANVVPDLDPNDPEVRKAMIAKATGTAQMLYPEQQALPAQTLPEIPADDEEDFESGEAQPAQPAYDPLAEESAPVQQTDPSAGIEAELDAKIGQLVTAIGPDKFKSVLTKHNITGLKGASIDLKQLVIESAEAVRDGRAA